ncbi:hypothetical protein BK816_07275 [Boudabousia tangfeifanii]|uniref:IrrE N-terminal-like domain-containing protein n=1 Tax=Boudabousia tangfeifanii TaxID=1912795 RepID=A0A1D9MLE8_9ACTO|nr:MULTISPECIES: ImmA/IrrE family metallo-endopeptidase [Boudabousia]AOZ73116.1 hypothetical protein BK816_07275 [Boudabousia tangfeifanii]OKL46977.1 hypothetical protein BSR28_06040 [Boudabousia liubingyangii]
MVSRCSKPALDARAQAVLRDYDPDLLRAPGALDVEHFAEFHLGASLQYEPLSPDGDILGLTCLEDTQVQVWDETRTTPLVRQGLADMIFLDETAEEGSCNGRKRFTLAHECSHLILHKPLAILGDFPSMLVNSQSKHTVEMRDGDARGEDWWVEWQADNMAAYLLMPTPAIKAALREVMAYDRGRGCVDFDGIATLCDIFEVSHQAMGMRLKGLGVHLVRDLAPVA